MKRLRLMLALSLLAVGCAPQPAQKPNFDEFVVGRCLNALSQMCEAVGPIDGSPRFIRTDLRAAGSGSGSGTVNSGTQYDLAYYAVAGTAVSALAKGSNGQVLTANTSGVPTWQSGLSLTGLTADTAPASGDLLLIYSQGASASESVTDSVLFGSPSAIGATIPSTGAFTTLTSSGGAALGGASLSGSNILLGTVSTAVDAVAPLVLTSSGTGISAPSWTTNGIALSGSATTLTDTTGTGTIATEAAVALPPYTIAATHTGVTVTYLAELYLPQPVAGANVTATSPLSLFAQGSINSQSAIYASYFQTGGATSYLGSLYLSGVLESSGTTFTLGTGTGACASTSTLKGGGFAGSFECTGTSGASTQVINMPATAANGYSCSASDSTSGVVWANEIASRTTAKIAGIVTTTSDVITFNCVGY